MVSHRPAPPAPPARHEPARPAPRSTSAAPTTAHSRTSARLSNATSTSGPAILYPTETIIQNPTPRPRRIILDQCSSDTIRPVGQFLVGPTPLIADQRRVVTETLAHHRVGQF